MPDVLALVEKGMHRLAFYNPATGECRGVLPLPDFPHEMALDPDGRTAYLGHYGARNARDPALGGSAVFVVDLLMQAHLHTIPLPGFHRIHGVACDGQGRLYALAEAEDALLVIENPKSATSPDHILPTGGKKGHLLAVTQDGETVFTSNLASHSVSLLRPKRKVDPLQINPGLRPEGLCLSQDETSLFVLTRGDAGLHEIACADGQVMRHRTLRGDCTRIYPYGRDHLLILDYEDRCIGLVERATLKEVAYLPLEGQPTGGCLHPTRPEVCIALEHGAVQVIHLARWEHLNSFQTGAEPDASILLTG
jgi:hypothetical protein